MRFIRLHPDDPLETRIWSILVETQDSGPQDTTLTLLMNEMTPGLTWSRNQIETFCRKAALYVHPDKLTSAHVDGDKDKKLRQKELRTPLFRTLFDTVRSRLLALLDESHRESRGRSLRLYQEFAAGVLELLYKRYPSTNFLILIQLSDVWGTRKEYPTIPPIEEVRKALSDLYTALEEPIPEDFTDEDVRTPLEKWYDKYCRQDELVPVFAMPDFVHTSALAHALEVQKARKKDFNGVVFGSERDYPVSWEKARRHMKTFGRSLLEPYCAELVEITPSINVLRETASGYAEFPSRLYLSTFSSLNARSTVITNATIGMPMDLDLELGFSIIVSMQQDHAEGLVAVTDLIAGAGLTCGRWLPCFGSSGANKRLMLKVMVPMAKNLHALIASIKGISGTLVASSELWGDEPHVLYVQQNDPRALSSPYIRPL